MNTQGTTLSRGQDKVTTTAQQPDYHNSLHAAQASGHTALMLVFASAKVLPEKFSFNKKENLNNAGLCTSNRHTPLHVRLRSPQACC